ncbi:uncharacterized protein BX663DRAFT_539799 [Cokeromyces recurvatus]|uniref:uncharacterized protein n=1 Tax=Cokeromyces recurvatus TaxID=90255 RepID=UPI0022209347|nr:uncharacterized protein BX663DRAFT_539799 [Cokeromyces recurvatus]KAI7907036.1 hypothetical protein BX663DRAFT_539799 [Cokeromyces recurvatus]
MFSTLGGVKKREPVFTFKRKIFFPLVDESLKKPLTQEHDKQLNLNGHTKLITTISAIQSSISPSSSSSSSSSSSTASSTSATLFELPKITTTNSQRNIHTKTCQPKQEEKKDEERITKGEDDTIFDFPDSLDNFSEVKVMVASTRTIPETPKLTRKRSKSKDKTQTVNIPKSTGNNMTYNNKKRAVANQKNSLAHNNSHDFLETSFIDNYNRQQQVQPFDIFAFDPDPISHITYNMNAQAAAATSTAFALPSSSSTFMPTTSFQQNYYFNTTYNNATIYNNNNQLSSYLQQSYNMNTPTPLVNNSYNTLSINSLLNDSTNHATTVQYDNQIKRATADKKRKKLNLVAHLKAANGEKENHDKTSLLNKEFDFLSDEDDIPEQPKQNEKTLQDRILNQKKLFKEDLDISL